MFMRRHKDGIMEDWDVRQSSLWDWVRHWARQLPASVVRGYAAHCHYRVPLHQYRPYL